MRVFAALPDKQQIGAATRLLDDAPRSWTHGHGGRRRRRALLVAVGILVSFACAIPHPSSAADPTSAQYCNGVGGGSNGCQNLKGEQASGGSGGGNPSSGTAAAEASGSSSGQLPFTGSDLFLLVAIAVAMTATGVVLTRVSGRRGRDSL